MQTQQSLLRLLEVIPHWMEKAHTISCYSGERRNMNVVDSVGTGMENALWVFLGLASITNSSSFTIQRLEEKCTFSQLMDGQPAPPIQLLPLPLSNQIPSIPLLCLSPGSLTGSSAPCTEPTFREIVYQLRSVDSLIPNPGTTSHLP